MNYFFCLLLFSLFINYSWAYEVFPEYRTLQADEVNELQAADKIDSEYQSDVLTFQKPFAWEYLWLKNNRAFDFSIGSLSGKRFAVENRLKIFAELGDWGRVSVYLL